MLAHVELKEQNQTFGKAALRATVLRVSTAQAPQHLAFASPREVGLWGAGGDGICQGWQTLSPPSSPPHPVELRVAAPRHLPKLCPNGSVLAGGQRGPGVHRGSAKQLVRDSRGEGGGGAQGAPGGRQQPGHVPGNACAMQRGGVPLSGGIGQQEASCSRGCGYKSAQDIVPWAGLTFMSMLHLAASPAAQLGFAFSSAPPAALALLGQLQSLLPKPG